MEPKRWSAVPSHLVTARLSALGVSGEILARAVDAGFQGAAGCTGHHPQNFAGIVTWGDAVRELRDLLVPTGWTAVDNRGFPTAVHPSGEHQIAVAAGTRDTGRHNGIPRTRRPKGIVAELAIADNQVSLDPTGAVFGVTYTEPTAQTWFLLHYADPIADEIRIELSLPAEMHKGVVTAWTERLIIDPLPGTREVPIEAPPEMPIDIAVTRRAT
jgi:hypothetical protein